MFVCPHAAIRPFIITKDEIASAPIPDKLVTLKPMGAEFSGKRYTLAISPLDCTGCSACIKACPDNALDWKKEENGKTVTDAEEKNWDYIVDLPQRGQLTDKYTVRGSQFQTPLMEFSGACLGCGETPYFKLLTQLFGERMVIANATGCSSIWGGSFPSNPYTTSKESGRGPAWANSLFEDNAEYGFGMFSSMRHRREKLASNIKEYVKKYETLPDELKIDANERQLVSLFNDWLEVCHEKNDKCTMVFDKMKPLFKLVHPEIESYSDHSTSSDSFSLLGQIWSDRDMFPVSIFLCQTIFWAQILHFYTDDISMDCRW